MKIESKTIVFPLIIGACAFGADAGEEVFPGADEKTPSLAQYFSWINNTNEGSTEEQTLANLAFFKWLHDEYGMKLDIYAFDAGNIDGPGTYGSMTSDKFKKQFPNGFKPIYEYAKSFGCRLGIWMGPDGFGDTPEDERARIDMLVSLCRDYDFALFKMDAVCTQLRPEKQEAFDRLMTACRKYSPDLILLNHRLKLGPAQKYATTWLWEGAETYIDVHMFNRNGGLHNRVQAISRNTVPELKRLTEDHGVCISSCLDFWEDDLILQAFNRCLILAPEIYGSPWFLPDDAYPRLARIYNLHRRYRDILVNGMELDRSYGPKAVSRGDDNTRLLTLRNLSWEPETRTIHLDETIGLKTTGTVEVRTYHPTERVLGRFNVGEKVEVDVLPFRSALILVEGDPVAELGITGSHYEVVRDVPGKDAVIKVLGLPGETLSIQLAGHHEAFKSATLDGKAVHELLENKAVSIQMPGELAAKPWYRKLGEATEIQVPADAEHLYEATCFSTDSEPFELRALKRSGPTEIPAVQKARQAFLDQEIFLQKRCLQAYLFDQDPATEYDFRRTVRYSENNRRLRIDMQRPQSLDLIELQVKGHRWKQRGDWLTTPRAQVSADLKTWKDVKDIEIGENNIRLHLKDLGPVAYLRSNILPDHGDAVVSDIRAFSGNEAVETAEWTSSHMLSEYTPASRAWSVAFELDQIHPGAYLTVDCSTFSTREVRPALRVDGKVMGFPHRAPSYPVNPWEVGVDRRGNTCSYFLDLTPEMAGKKMEVVILAQKDIQGEHKPTVWLNSYPNPYDSKELVLERR